MTNAGDYTLFVTNSTGSATSQVAHLEVDPAFTKITTGAIVTKLGYFVGCAWGDYDNDGFLDLFVARSGETNWLYHNNGDGTYSLITNSILPDKQDRYSAAWGDYNNDGLPDLFITAKSDPPTNQLYLNLGGGSFARVTTGSIATNRAHSFGCAWGDYDNDGFLDLFVGNGGYLASESNFLPPLVACWTYDQYLGKAENRKQPRPP